MEIINDGVSPLSVEIGGGGTCTCYFSKVEVCNTKIDCFIHW